ncbi:hypothetical protein EHV15_34725 [Paenibacillus oralis]|uniref:Uncharacterized protein n=1 Tax=Paenibacillus oralis TaxID=2490856 RepID=A0A3P3T9T1_9BACL|nr:hypothetical protein [Paenibacillus oralis]RRJ54750.1 hypothetical protein EHV15_34725 [Paenibacillus oralis]
MDEIVIDSTVFERDEVENSIKKAIEKATLIKYGSQVEVYGDQDGVIRVVAFPNTENNRPTLGDRKGEVYVPIYRITSFRPLDKEDLGEWWTNDKPDDAGEMTWEEYSSANSGGWQATLARWEEVWMDVNVPEMVENAMIDLE